MSTGNISRRLCRINDFPEPSGGNYASTGSPVVEDQCGVISSVEEMLSVQAQNGQICRNRWYFHLKSLITSGEQKSLMPWKELLAKGADVIMLIADFTNVIAIYCKTA